MRSIISYIIVFMSIFKVVTSFTQNLEYGELFNVQINIWIYRALWVFAGAASAYSLIKFYKDKKQFGPKS